jgi:hypothetical protein
MSNNLELGVALRRIEDNIERQGVLLKEIESKVGSLLDMAQRSAELTTRIKLMADMAKDAGFAQSQAIEQIAQVVASKKAG